MQTRRGKEMATEVTITGQRAQSILHELHRSGSITVEELATKFNVSTITIRRDLVELEQKGLLRRVHGGAIPVQQLLYEPFRHDSSFQEQVERQVDEKRRIGLAAAELIENGDTVAFTAGTTTTQATRSIGNNKHITVVTNTVNVAMELSQRSEINVFVTGGFLRGGWFSLVGPSAINAMSQIFVDKVFIGVNGIHAEHGLTAYHPEEAAFNRAMIEQARQKIVLADHTKLGKIVTSLIYPTKGIDTLITDSGASEESIAPFIALGMKVIRV
jgi:DeoR family transcriptional regulator, aga operon transcriptional repressor